MQDCKVFILGEEWNIKFGTAKDYPMLEDAVGYADSSVREIVVSSMEDSRDDKAAKKDLTSYQKEVVRHECIHAYLEAAGLANNSHVYESGWATNEEMVDWFAIQSPKIFKTFSDLGLI